MHIDKKLLMAVLLLAVGAFFILGGSASRAGEEPEHAEEAHEHESEAADSTVIDDGSAAAMGIETVVAGPASIRETIRLSGRMALNRNRSADVKARFPGIVRDVFRQVGDSVKRGDKLAAIESNESLQVYTVPAPLDGVVLERTVSIGDTAGEQPIFTVADLLSLWAEFFIFAADMGSVRQGQAIIIRSLDGKASAMSTVLAIQPTAEASSQTVLARAEVANTEGIWRSGMTVQGYVVISERPVGIAVPNAAIQQLEGKDVVFVKTATRYTATPITRGKADAEMTEIVAGVIPGTEVVSDGSFIVKADIGKAGAGHEH